jgi:hypothetical protein
VTGDSLRQQIFYGKRSGIRHFPDNCTKFVAVFKEMSGYGAVATLFGLHFNSTTDVEHMPYVNMALTGQPKPAWLFDESPADY